MHVHTISNIIGIKERNKDTNISSTKKEHISGYRKGRANMIINDRKH